jgi:hypothetical protein
MRWTVLLCLGGCLALASLTRAEKPTPRPAAADVTATLTVTSDFPSGSAEVQAIDQKTRRIRIVPARHPDRGWACWWYFKVAGIKPGETLTLDVGDGGWATPDRAVFSTDGKSWRQTEPGKRVAQRITYQQQIDAAEAWFAWGPPFTPADANELDRTAAEKCSQATAFELCKSLEGRPVPALKFEPKPSSGTKDRTPGIVVVARQHAWEVGSSWVCQGLVEWLVSDEPRAAALRKKSRVLIVPVMDVDNVTIGAGGKEQRPQDHNRDWTDHPYFPAVAAVQAELKKMDAAGQLDLFVDLHDPAPSDSYPFFFVSPRGLLLSEVAAANVERFLQGARLEMTGPLAFRGESRESGPDYDANWPRIGKNWVTKNMRPHVVAMTLEVPWNTPQSTTDGYKQVGRELGQAMERYFRTK